jgi:hypothetical protein
LNFKHGVALCVLASLFHCMSRPVQRSAEKQETSKNPNADPSDNNTESRSGKSINVMSALQIGPFNQSNPLQVFLEPQLFQADWDFFLGEIREAKRLGAFAVSTDVWWGVAERSGDNQFDWKYYKKMAQTVKDAGLKWVPILSFHQCGGNVGDTCDVPLPSWVFETVAMQSNKGLSADDIKNKSSQGNVSGESVSVFASDLALNQYKEFMNSFQENFKEFSENISEINVSLGPAGELRYPSYNSHDQGTGFPTRGAMQGYSKLAISQFRDSVKTKYGTLEALNRAWSTNLSSFDNVNPPDNADQFANTNAINQPYGKDLYEWYHKALLAHGERLLETTFEIFDAPDSAFKGIDVGAKIPGVHWRMATDRFAELNAGLVDPTLDLSSQDSNHVLGYKNLLGMFQKIVDAQKAKLGARFVLHFTCLEMPDDGDGPAAASKAQTLVRVIGQAASASMPIKGENALSGTLGGKEGWDRMSLALDQWGYQGLTILRVGDALRNKQFFEPFLNRFK